MTPGFGARALRHPSFVVGATLGAAAAGRLLSPGLVALPAGRDRHPSKLQPPSAAHWLGTDSLGRDIASQLLVGAQNSIVVGVVAVGIGLVIGVALGCLAAARRGWVEELVMRAADFTFAFPALLSAIMLGAIYGPGCSPSIVAIGIFNIPVFARISRGAAKAVWAREYVLAARSRLRAVAHHAQTMCCPTSPAC
jgi:peptide/nickel transport system permease protein